MDAAFVPSEVVIRHSVSHKFTIEFGPSILGLGKPIRNFILCALVLYSVGNIVRGSLQAVLNRYRGGTAPEQWKKYTAWKRVLFYIGSSSQNSHFIYHHMIWSLSLLQFSSCLGKKDVFLQCASILSCIHSLLCVRASFLPPEWIELWP